jgi:two-component system chemotaxis sensor kinase CheA
VELGNSLRTIVESKAQIANLLDNSGEGFLSFGADLIVDAEFSRACEVMLGSSPAGRPADAVLFGDDPQRAEQFRATIAAVSGENDPWRRGLMLALLPRELRRGTIRLEADYKTLESGHIMVILADVTEERRLADKVESDHRRMAMIVAAVTESRDFFDVVEAFRRFAREDLDRLLTGPEDPAALLREVYRRVHTFKGSLGEFAFQRTPAALHGLESRLSVLGRSGGALTVQQVSELARSVDYEATLDADLDVVRLALGDEFLKRAGGVLLSDQQAKVLRDLAGHLSKGVAPDEAERKTLAQFSRIGLLQLSDALAVFDRGIAQMAERLEKPMAPLAVDGGGDVWIDPDALGPFLRALGHVFRNAVIHGIEAPDRRLQAGKPAAGSIICRIGADAGTVRIEIADDGAGIDRAALRSRAVRLGLQTQDVVDGLADRDILDLVFRDEVTTREIADDLAGRGVGLAAVRAETRRLAGDVSVESVRGVGTTFRFTLPLRSIAAAPVVGDRVEAAV